MELHSINAISPVDGRYRKVCEPLEGYFSESALIRYRIRVEAAYLLALRDAGISQLRDLNPKVVEGLKSLSADAKDIDTARVKAIESVTNQIGRAHV